MPQNDATAHAAQYTLCDLPAARVWGSLGRGSVQASQEARAALREYDGRLPRDEAERVAWACSQNARDV